MMQVITPEIPGPSSASGVRSVSIHVSRKLDRVIVAPTCRNKAGVYCEQDAVEVIAAWPAPDEFGAAFQRAFERFSTDDKGIREHKRSDWPSYKASGLRTISRFEQEFVYINCTGLNPSNAIVRASARHPINPNVELSVLFNPRSDESTIGKLLTELAHLAVAT